MARHVDENKIIAIKKATIETVVIDGVSGASVSKIAKKADVSVGYLYRFYKGKRELLEILFEERFQIIHSLLKQQVETQKTVKDILTVFIEKLYKITETEPKTISFTHKLLSDFSFELPVNFKKNVTEICEEVLKIGRKTNEIDESINHEMLYTVIVGGTLNFINIRLRKIFEKDNFTSEDIDNIIHLLLKTLAPKY